MDDLDKTQEPQQEPVPTDVEPQQVASEPEPVEPGIRGALKANLRAEPQQLKAKAAAARPDQYQGPQTQEPVQQQQPAVLPPGDMNAQERALFAQAPAELQAYLSRRAHEVRSELSRQSNEYKEAVQVRQAIEQTWQPYAEEYSEVGVDAVTMLDNAIAWDQAFKNDPIRTAWEYLEVYGIHPQDLLGYDYQPQPQQQPEYLTREQAEEIAVQKFKEQQEIDRQARIVEGRTNALDSFMKSKPLFNDAGSRAQLEELMAPRVAAEFAANPSADPLKVLEDVYSYILNTNPAFSGYTAKQKVEQKAAVASKAKAASKSLTGSPGSGSPRIQTNLRENLRLRLSGSV